MLAKWQWNQIQGYHVHQRDDPTDMEIFSLDVRQGFGSPLTFAFECDDACALHEAFFTNCPDQATRTTNEATALVMGLADAERRHKQPVSANLIHDPTVENELSRLEGMMSSHQQQQQTMDYKLREVSLWDAFVIVVI